MGTLSRLFRLDEPTVVRVEFRDRSGRLIGWRNELCDPCFPRRRRSRPRRIAARSLLRATG
jgi:hypothetical protein